MHYGIVAIGSRGDVQPYVALALGLMERGHGATVMAHENFRDFVGGYGVEFISLRGNVEAMLQSEEGMRTLKAGNIVAFTRYLQKITVNTVESIVSDTLEACEKADVLIASLLALPWVQGLAEKLGKKWAIVQLNLPTVMTKAFPMAGLDLLNFPAYNSLTYRFYEFAYHQAGKKLINCFRKSLDLPQLKISLLKKIADEKVLNLHCFSPSLLSRPDDWAPQNQITGFLFLPPTINEKIPGDLIRWLNAGDCPIYIGFGSIPIPNPQLLISILTELLRITNHRFIFCQGWSLPIDQPEHPNLFQIKTISHQWLFPHCKTVIIHGGVGTTAAALNAKIPAIIISIIADQPWWGKIIERKKLGVHLPFKKLSAQKLLSAIEKTQDPEILQNAFDIGEKISREDGLRQTIDTLEKYFDIDAQCNPEN
jgi:sterol 3beta-glucosyltransferase